MPICSKKCSYYTTLSLSVLWGQFPSFYPTLPSLFSNQNSPKIDQLLIHLSQIDSVHMLDMFGAWATQWLGKNRHLTNNKWHSSHSYNHEIARVQLQYPFLPPLAKSSSPFPPTKKEKYFLTFLKPCLSCVFPTNGTLICAGIFPPSFIERTKIRWNDQSNSSFSKPIGGWKIVRSFEPPCWYGMIRSPAVYHFKALNVSSDMQGGKEYLASKWRICSTKNEYKIQWSSLQKLRPHT